MNYPAVMSEEATIDAALSGASLSRFGDGELRLALGKSCASQVPVPALADELKQILAGKTKALPCIPNILPSPRSEFWEHYADPKYRNLMRSSKYGSAFVTRPDNMPSIDHPEYWSKVRQLWAGKDVILVAGDEKSLTPGRMAEAQSVEVVSAPRRDAYTCIDQIHRDVVLALRGRKVPVILCLGATATVLAHRLAAEKQWALDLGHLGMFMKSAGAYSIPPENLASKKHKIEVWGRTKKISPTGWKHAGRVMAFAREIGAESILDYGSGHGTLKIALEPVRVYEYDVGIPERSSLPKPCNLIVCTDVLTWVEPDKVESVLLHMSRLASKGIYATISCSSSEVEKLWRKILLAAFPSAQFEISDDWLIARIKK